MTTYTYRRCDNDELVEVDFERHMANVGGFITLPDGADARRVPTGSFKASTKVAPDVQKTIVSDNLGCTAWQVDELRADAAKNGFRDVEFRPDPREPSFYQAHIKSRREWKRYVSHRHLLDNNGRNGSGAMLSEADFERLKERFASE